MLINTQLKSAFEILKGWSSKFEVNGISYGGDLDLINDWRLQWHLDMIGGAIGKMVLELGPLEGGHTVAMEEAGANVIAIEGNQNNFLKCLIVKNQYDLKAKFVFGDFCEYIKNYSGRFDFVSAAGVLYHQKNPAELIYDLSRITDTVLVWSQVANDEHPSKVTHFIYSHGKEYAGKLNDYNGAHSTDNFCGGLEETAFWMYEEEMLRCFRDAGFKNIIQKDCGTTKYGDAILFVARK